MRNNFMLTICIFFYVRVMRSLSDAHEIPLSLGFTKFEEKKKQQSEKKSKTIKSIIKRGHTSKGIIIFMKCGIFPRSQKRLFFL